MWWLLELFDIHDITMLLVSVCSILCVGGWSWLRKKNHSHSHSHSHGHSTTHRTTGATWEYEVTKFAAFCALHQLAIPLVLTPALPVSPWSPLHYADWYVLGVVSLACARALHRPRMPRGAWRALVAIPACASVSYTCLAALFVPAMPFAPFAARMVPIGMGFAALAWCLFADPTERVHIHLAQHHHSHQYHDSTRSSPKPFIHTRDSEARMDSGLEMEMEMKIDPDLKQKESKRIVHRDLKDHAAPYRAPSQHTFTCHKDNVALPADFPKTQPLKICQITDTHIGVYMSVERVQKICRDALRARPDLILLTGDYLTFDSVHTPGAMQEALLPLREAQGKVFACLGNHDYDTGALSVVKSSLRSLGIRLLDDEQEFVTIDGFGTVQIVGSRHHFNERRARLHELSKLCPRQQGVFRLWLLHDPGAFRHLPDGEADLVLSGHTHGGIWGLRSFYCAWTVVSGVLGMPDHGLWYHGANALYVHRGQGNHGIPTRFGVASQEGVLYVYRSTLAHVV